MVFSSCLCLSSADATAASIAPEDNTNWHQIKFTATTEAQLLEFMILLLPSVSARATVKSLTD